MILGKSVPAKEPVKVTTRQRRATHTHVIGSTGMGKSKLLEWMIREDISAGRGLCLLDWHGTLYRAVAEYLSYFEHTQEVVLLDLSHPRYVVGFNPFAATAGDPSTLIENRIDATIKPWGMKNTDQTPTLERICRLFYQFVLDSGESLSNASMLLNWRNKDLREYAVRVVKDLEMREEWADLLAISTPREWREQTGSTKNRLARFVASRSIKRFTSLKDGNIDIRRILDTNGILLVNLGRSNQLSKSAAKVFAALLLNQFFEEALERAEEEPALFPLYLDEFQEYITDDMAAMLDQVRKGGLHLVMAHQRMGHLLREPDIKDAITANAKIKIVFGGLPVLSAKEMAEEIYLSDVNEWQIKKQFHGYATVGHDLEQFTNVIEASGETSSELPAGSASGRSSSTTFGTQRLLRPKIEKIEVPSPEWSPDEKIRRYAERLIRQPAQHCTINVQLENSKDELYLPPTQVKVMTVKPVELGAAAVRAFEKEACEKAGGLPAATVDHMIEASRLAFLEKVKADVVEESYTSRKKVPVPRK